MIPVQAKRQRMFADQLGSFASSFIDRAVKIAGNGRIPAGFAMAKQGQRLHGML